jgi:hypothetical protein
MRRFACLRKPQGLAALPGGPAQAIKRELLGTCAIKNAI